MRAGEPPRDANRGADPCEAIVMRIASCTLTLVLIGAASGCALSPLDAEATPADQLGTATTDLSAFVLTVSGIEAGVNVASPGRTDFCPEGPACNFAYIEGSALTISPSATQNLADCARFTGWRGACAGQGATCSLVINSALSTSTIWKFGGIPGCVPK
jgi:hypothetical protein